MKINFSNFVKLFLAGASLLAVGCTDYGQDIQNLNDRIDDLQTDVIDPLAVDLEAVKADLAAAKTDLQAKIDANKALIDGLTDELATAKSNIKANADAIAAAQGDIDNLEKAVETINGQIDNLDKAVEDLKAQDAVFAKDIADLKTAVANNTAEIAKNKQDIANLTQKVDDHLAAYALFVEKVDAKFIALDKEIEALKAKDKEIDAAIKALQDKDIELEGLINALQDAYTLLEGRVSTIEQEFAEHLKAFDAVVDRVSKLEAGHDAQQILIEANQQAIKNLQDELANTNGRVATLETGLEEQKKALADAKKELQDNIDALDVKLSDYMTKNDAAVKANADAIKKLNDDLTALETKLTNLINSVQDALQKQIDAIKGDLSALKGRIQSLVFVPEHVDGAATIHWAQLGNTLVEGQSVLLYQVYPAECAAAVEAEELQFVFTEALATSRANAPVLEVVNVAPVAKKEGVIAVTVNARNLGADFYAGSVKYAVSLVLANKTANIASCYVNLAPATADQLDVKLINDTAEQYKIEYVDTKTAHVILPDHKYAFSINGEGAYTIEGMLEKGYVITVEKAAPTYAVNDAQLPNVFKNVVDESNPYLNFVTVSIDPEKVTKDSVGLVETVTYSYNVCGKDLTASATVRIVKIQRAIEMKGADIVWTYAEDAKSDAGLEATNSTDVATIVSHTLPADVTYENVLAVTPTVTVTVDGKEDKNVTAVIAGTTDKPTIALTNFAWGKTYTITALYELSSIDVTLTATVNTVDRVREKIFVELLDSEKVIGYKTYFTYENSLTDVKDLKEKSPAQKTIFEQIVANKTNVGKMTEADFLKEVLVTKKNGEYVLSNTYNGAEATADTGLVLDANGVKSTVEFSYVDVTTMPNSVKYVYNVTTWYGQVIEIVKTVNLKLPIDGVYDFVDVPQWVYTKKNSDVIDYYYSVVLPEYYYGTSTPIVISSLESFNASRIDMESAFKVKFTGKDLYDDTYENKVFTFYEELAKEPYCVDVKFELSPVQQGAIISEFEGYKLNYKDYNKLINHVFVTGKLFQKVLVGKNGDVELKELTGTRFSKGNDLDDYRVRPYQIENKFDVVTGTFYLDNASPFYIDVRTFIQLTDNRPNAEGKFSWLQYTIAGQTYYNRDQAIRVVDDSRNSDDPVKLSLTDIEVDFTNGDGENGFAKGFKADQVYKPFELRTSIVESSIPEHLRNDKNKINFTESTHELFVNGNAQLNLTEVMPLDILVELVYVHKGQPITYRETTLTINIKPLESPVQPQP